MNARLVTSTEFQRNFGTVVTDLTVNQQTTVVTNHGRPQFVMVPAVEYAVLLRRAERADNAAR